MSEGTFENTFVKQDGAWRIQSVHFYPRMIVDAATGWARSAKPAPGPSTEFPPDRPPTSSYAIYPKFAVAPFHFDNPVTGRPPQYPEGVQAARPSATAGPRMQRPSATERSWRPRLAEVERGTATAEAYDAVENLIGAFGYGRDGAALSDGGTSFVSQISQPVIEIATGRQERKDPRTPAGATGHIGRRGRMGRRRVRGHCRTARRLMETSGARSRPHLVGILSGRLGSYALRAVAASCAMTL